MRPRGSPTTKAAAEPASAPKRERLTTRPDWKDDSWYLENEQIEG